MNQFPLRCGCAGTAHGPTELYPPPVCLAVMFGHNSRKDRSAPSDGESRQPLLSRSHEDSVQDEGVIFAIDDDEDETNNIHPGNRSPEPERPEHSVRFQEEVQVIGPPLKSTIQSRETGEYPRTHVHAKSQIPSKNSSWIRTT